MSVGIAIQLNPPIRVYTPKGAGYAHIFSQFGPESDQQWTVFLDNGQIWDMPNYRVRAQNNWSLGRDNPGLKEELMEEGNRTSKPCECSVQNYSTCTHVGQSWNGGPGAFYHCRKKPVAS